MLTLQNTGLVIEHVKNKNFAKLACSEKTDIILATRKLNPAILSYAVPISPGVCQSDLHSMFKIRKVSL